MTTNVRADILGFVERYPAVHVRELERQLHLSSKLASYHLAALAEAGLVRRVQDDGYVRWLATRTGARLTEVELRALCILRRPPAFRIVGEILAQGELPHRRLASALGLAKASVSYHLKALESEGIVVAREEGRERLYRLASPSLARRLLTEFDPLPGELDAFAKALADLLSAGRRRNG